MWSCLISQEWWNVRKIRIFWGCSNSIRKSIPWWNFWLMLSFWFSVYTRTALTLRLPLLAVYGECILTHVAKGGERNDRSNLQTFLLLSPLCLPNTRWTTGQMSEVEQTEHRHWDKLVLTLFVCRIMPTSHKWWSSPFEFLRAARADHLTYAFIARKGSDIRIGFKIMLTFSYPPANLGSNVTVFD